MKHKDLKQGQVYLVNHYQDWAERAPNGDARRMLLDVTPYDVSRYSYGRKEDVETPYGIVQATPAKKATRLPGAQVLMSKVNPDGTPNLEEAYWAAPRDIRGTWEEASAVQAKGYAEKVERERKRSENRDASRDRAQAITDRFAALGLENVRAHSSGGYEYDRRSATISATIGPETLEAILDRLEAAQ